MVKSKPNVILSGAVTLDGKIATRTGDSQISSRKDKVRVHKLRTKVDAILVGSNTVEQDDPLLTIRYAKGKNPIRIILDSKGRISSSSRIIKTCRKIPTIIAVSKKISKKNLARLERYPLDVIICGEKKINLRKLLQLLAKRKIKKILLEGGGTVNWEFIKEGLVDEVIVTIAPYLVGGEKAITLVQGFGYAKIEKSARLKLQRVIRLGNELVLHYSNRKFLY